MKTYKITGLSLFAIGIFLATTLTNSLYSSLMAQESTSQEEIEREFVQEQVELTRASIQSDRKGIVSQYMDLTPEESESFWPLYKEYRSEATKLNDQLTKLILDYGDRYRKQDISDQQAEQMLSDYLVLEQDKLDLRQDYVTKFQEVLPAIKVTRYFQLENKMDAVVDYNLAGNIPLVE